MRERNWNVAHFYWQKVADQSHHIGSALPAIRMANHVRRLPKSIRVFKAMNWLSRGGKPVRYIVHKRAVGHFLEFDKAVRSLLALPDDYAENRNFGTCRTIVSLSH